MMKNVKKKTAKKKKKKKKTEEEVGFPDVLYKKNVPSNYTTAHHAYKCLINNRIFSSSKAHSPNKYVTTETFVRRS